MYWLFMYDFEDIFLETTNGYQRFYHVCAVVSVVPMWSPSSPHHLHVIPIIPTSSLHPHFSPHPPKIQQDLN